jgi:flagellar basal-body rod protein FlgF
VAARQRGSSVIAYAACDHSCALNQHKSRTLRRRGKRAGLGNGDCRVPEDRPDNCLRSGDDEELNMDALMAAAASGIRARMESLDILANNLANSSAAGFKSDQASYGLYVSPEAADSPEGTNPAILPVVQNRWTDFAQGALIPTGSSMDLALSGKGFFVANTPSGPLYTRGGSFRFSRIGQLQTEEGYYLQGIDGKPILVDSSKPIEVSIDGTVQQDGQEVSQIAVVDFEDPKVLAKRGGNYFKSNASTPPTPASQAEIRQGQLEKGNSDSTHAASSLVTILRQFEALQKAMTIGADMNRRAVEDVAKVSS